MSITIKQLSDKCGLSVSTVSKALNGYDDISEETKKLVRQTAEALGYRPNAQARALKLGRSFNLGVLFADDNQSGLKHSYFSAVLDSFKVEAESRGYDITFINHNIGRSRMTYLEHCRYRGVDGVCLACVDFAAHEVRELVESDLPLVTIDYLFNDRACVLSDNRSGMEQLARHVWALGHRRIAYIHGERNAVTAVRLTSLRRTLAELGGEAPEKYLVPSYYHNPGAAREAVEQLLSLKERPTCILFSDDYAALGGIEALRAAGLSIPEDISIAGYDGIPLMQMFRPRLTTVEQDTLAIGSQAARRLVHLIEKPRTTFADVLTIPSRLLEGETVKAPNP